MTSLNFGQMLKELVSVSGIRITHLANELGYDSSYLSRWLSGAKTPSLRNNSNLFSKISDAIICCSSNTGLEALLQKYGCAEENLGETIEMLLSVAGKTDPKYMQEHFPNFLRLGSYTVNEVFRAMKMPKLAQDIMGTYWGYLGVDMDHLSFLQYVNMLWLYVNHGAWIPDKTSNELTTGLLECFRRMGGEVWMNCTATEILFDENKAVRGVKTTCGEVETKHILCNMNQNMVYATMCPSDVVPERMVKLGNARTYSARMFVVYLGLDKSAEELGIHDYTIFIPTSADTAKAYESGRTLATNCNQVMVCYNVVNPGFSPEGTCVMSLTSTFMDDDWANVEQDDYVRTKTDFAEKLIGLFEQRTGITVTPYIEEIEIATPWTMCNYVNTPEGSAYGFELKDWDNMMPRMMMMGTEFPVKGLKFVGAASIRGDGYNSAIFSGDTLAKKTLAEMKAEEA